MNYVQNSSAKVTIDLKENSIVYMTNNISIRKML